ncbi:MAG TPA: glycoside hydrolase family 15 protein [Nitrospira sp.]|nr:glycoside hydrolase family 15 protein [Nitrospira sp.]
MYLEDYAFIGDTHTGALVGRNGSVDWLCLPRFDSNACFAALLGNEQNGRWIIAPADQEHRVTRRYQSDTLILETDFTTKDGTVRVVDCMPIRQDYPTVVRLVMGLHGSVRMHMQLILRFDYGSVVPWVTKHTNGLHAVAGPDSVYIATGAPTHGKQSTRVSDFVVHANQQIPFTLIWHPSHKPVPSAPDAAKAIDETAQWWRQWTSRCHPEGEHREAVIRSLITLKALIYAPTGGIVAAPTTSLPECLGGVRNWDYRYCWIRDATYTLYALLTAGYKEEASNWRDWLIRTIAGDPSQLQIMYGIAGERRLTELELPWLSGYEGSTPVRTGNAAWRQLQLDVFGEVMDTLHQARRTGMETNERGWDIQTTMMEYLESKWKEPDEGIWEIRGPRRHFTHSKIMAWVATDRMVKDIEAFHLPGDAARWKQVREQIHQEVCDKGFDPSRNTFTQYYGSRQPDASLLMIPLVGFLSPDDPRVQGTVQAIEKELCHDGLILRYSHEGSQDVDGLPSGEGTFLACSFWLANTYVLQGRHNEAEQLFQRLLALRNDLGLLSEEYDTGAKRLVGNFPQALSHLSLVNTAYTLSNAAGPSQHRQSTEKNPTLESGNHIER